MQLLSLTVAALSVASLSTAHLAESSHHHNHLHARDAAQPVDPKVAEIRKRTCMPGLDHIIPRDANGNRLARRALPAMSKNGMPYPTPGEVPPESSLPQVWIQAYQKAKAAGLIPDIPRSVLEPSGANPYPPGTDLTKVCSWTATKCNDGDIYQAPRRHIAFGLDDGPTPLGTGPLIELMAEKKFSATHFLIGSAIAWNSDILLDLVKLDPPPHLAVHTWSHTLQTTKTDLEILGDLAWTQQIIYDLTGVIPMHFRPPQGDADARVRAIAKHVLGMQTVLWNHDADDWCLREGTGTAKGITTCETEAPDLETVTKNQVSWVSGRNMTGVLTLNHETSDQGIKAFGAMYDAALANKPRWTISGTVPDLNNLPWYLNQYGPNDKPKKQDNILPTRDFIDLPDGGLGSVPYNLGNWAALAPNGAGNGSTSTGSRAGSSTGSNANAASAGTGSSSSARPASGASTASGAAAARNLPVAMLLGGVAMAAALLA